MQKYLKKIYERYKKRGQRAAFFIGFFILLIGSFFLFYKEVLLSKEPIFIYVRKGSTHRSFSELLSSRKIVDNSFLVRVALSVFNVKLKQGEYLLPAGASLWDIIFIVTKGKVHQRFITFPEGITAWDTCKILDKMPGLTGACPYDLKEGAILPNTYAYLWGESKKALLMRCHREMKKEVEQLWKYRLSETPLKTPEELVILASIVEKETSKPEERPLVAAVFLNRLKKGMPLQADPTVLYGINKERVAQGKKLKGALSKEDLCAKSSKNLYNTYKMKGLPPSPISHPGKAALEAVISPSKEAYLYFVADSTGGHIFSKSLKNHILHHKKWRQYKKQNRAKVNES